jgi:hypothetical protein
MIFSKLIILLLISNFVLFSCKSDNKNPLNEIKKGIWVPVSEDTVPYIMKGLDMGTDTNKTDTIIFSSPPVWFVDEDKSRLNTFYIIPHEHRIFQDSAGSWRVDFHNKNNNWLLSINASKDIMSCTLIGENGNIQTINYKHLSEGTTSPFSTLKEAGNLLNGTNWIREYKDGLTDVFAFTEAENINQDSIANYSSFKISAISYKLSKNQLQNNNHFTNIGFYKFQDFIFIDLFSGINESKKYLIKSINEEMNRIVLIPTADNYQFADKEIIWTRPENGVPLSDSLRGIWNMADSLNSL